VRHSPLASENWTSHITWKLCKIIGKLLLISKSYMSFRLVQKSMTHLVPFRSYRSLLCKAVNGQLSNFAVFCPFVRGRDLDDQRSDAVDRNSTEDDPIEESIKGKL